MAPLDRRELLRLGAAAAVATGLPATACAASPTHERGLKKSLKIGMVKVEGSLLDRFRLLKAIGFDGVELDSPSDLDPEEVLAARAQSGLEIPGVVDSRHWRDPLSDPSPATRARGVEALETALRDCRRFGGTTVLLVPGIVGRDVAYDDAWHRSQAEIRRVLPLAEELGVQIALENVWNHFLLSPLEAARYVDELDSPWVGWYLDVGNVVNVGWPQQWVRILGKRVLKVDVKEFSRTKRDDEGLWKGFDVPLLEGDCDWPAVMAALDEIGYRGWASAEVGGGGEARLREIAGRMDRILAS